MRVNYDEIAHVYDDRRRDHPPDERLAAYLGRRAAVPGGLRVLDVGCGTGKQLAENVGRFPGIAMIGVDRSARMLAIARARSDAVRWIQGDAMALPIASSSIDYATNQFSYPHIRDKQAFVSEVFRVLRPGGRFVITNIDPWAMPGWVIYRYFPEARAVDERDFLPVEALDSLLAAAGFDNFAFDRDDRSAHQDLAAFLQSASARHSASQLMAIPDAAYEAGLQRLREDVARGTAAPRSDFTIVTLRADKPKRPAKRA